MSQFEKLTHKIFGKGSSLCHSDGPHFQIKSMQIEKLHRTSIEDKQVYLLKIYIAENNIPFHSL